MELISKRNLKDGIFLKSKKWPKRICRLVLFDNRIKRCEIVIYKHFKNLADCEVGDFLVISFSQLRRDFTIDKTMTVLYA